MFTQRTMYRKTKTRTLNIAVAFTMLASIFGGALVPAVTSQKAAAAGITYQMVAQPSTVTVEAGTTVGSLFALTEFKADGIGWNDLVAWGNSTITASVTGGAEVSKDKATWGASATLHFSALQAVQGTFYLRSATPGTFPVSLSSSVVTLLSGTINRTASATLVVTTVEAPTVTLNAPANNTLRNNGNVTFTWTGTPGTYPIDKYEIAGTKAGSGEFSATSSSQSYTTSGALGDGNYTWKVRAKDNKGNWGPWSDTWAFTIDSTAPELPEHLYPLNNSFQNFNDFYFDWTDVADAVEYEFQSSQSPSTDSNGALNSGVWNNKVNGAPDRNFLASSTIHSYGANGTWYWQVRAIDSAGNKSAWTAPWKVTIDMVAPSAPTITNPSNGQYFTSAPILNKWTAASDAGGIAKYQIAYHYDDGHAFGDSTCPGLTMNGYSGFVGCRDLTDTQRNHVPTAGEQGGVTIWVRALDKAGNWSDWSAPVHYYYDATPPSVPTGGSPHMITLNSNVFNYTWNPSTDNVSDITYEYQASQNPAQVGGVLTSNLWQNWVHGDATQNPLNSPLIPSVGTSDGTWYWQVRAVDAAGNKSAWSEIWHFTLDSVAPDVPIAVMTEDDSGDIVPAGGYTNSQFFTFGLTSSPDTVRYQLKYWNDIAGSPFKELTPWSPTDLTAAGHMATLGTYTDTFTQGEGTHYFAFSACDAAGNCSSYSAPFAVTFDKTPPSVSIPTYSQSDDAIQPDAQASDANPITSYLWVASPLNPAGATFNPNALNPVFIVTNEGDYSFDLTVTDVAGNSTTVTFSFTYAVPEPEEQAGQEQAGQEEETTPPAPAAPTFTNVQAASTSTPPSPAPVDDGQEPNEPEEVLSTNTSEPSGVEGASTTAVDITENAASTGNKNLLGLGWWWLAVLGALAIIWLLFFARRSSENSD